MYNTAYLTNTGTFDFDSDARFYTWGTGDKRFTNDGIVRKTGGEGTKEIQVYFENNGLLDIQIGTINFTGGGG